MTNLGSTWYLIDNLSRALSAACWNNFFDCLYMGGYWPWHTLSRYLNGIMLSQCGLYLSHKAHAIGVGTVPPYTSAAKSPLHKFVLILLDNPTLHQDRVLRRCRWSCVCHPAPLPRPSLWIRLQAWQISLCLTCFLMHDELVKGAMARVWVPELNWLTAVMNEEAIVTDDGDRWTWSFLEHGSWGSRPWSWIKQSTFRAWWCRLGVNGVTPHSRLRTDLPLLLWPSLVDSSQALADFLVSSPAS